MLPDNFASDRYAVRETHTVPKGWERLADAPKDHQLQLQIGLRQGRFNELQEHLYDVSDPAHARYGQHLSSDEVNELIKPSEDAISQVSDWLQAHSIASSDLDFSTARDWISLRLPVEVAERLLDTRYSVYKHDDGSHIVRAPQWSLPEHLHEHIVAIQPTTSFLRASPNKRTFIPVKEVNPEELGFVPQTVQNSNGAATGNVSAVCNPAGVTPDCLRTLYETIDYSPQTNGTVKIGLNNFLGESNNRTDVEAFLQQYRPDAVGAAQTFTDISIDDPVISPTGGEEGNLDAETILGISFPLPLVAYSTGGSPPFNPDLNTPTNTNEPYLEWVNYVLGQSDADIPGVISTSYGDDEQTVPIEYATTVCNQFAQLGARGVSLLFSSGDGGVGPNGSCVSNDGLNTQKFIPNFPAGCPFVTTIGATKDFEPEVAAEDPRNGFHSGGGFSNYFAQPSYQAAQVNDYIAGLGDEYAGLYNRSGRGYPDFSAQGQAFITIYKGRTLLLDGTSASAPTAASVIALVNDALVAAGKAPLGFLNPFLYSNGSSGFVDVTSGSASGCDVAGFPAVAGWDAVTGFGTPRFTQLLGTLGLG